MTTEPVLKRRCAVYTRKSSEEGLDQAYNSLDAQREACEAYILSQKSEGWILVRDRYDDGGFSGGNMERPGLKRLLADIDAGKIDIVVVYKIDRLSRYLPDFGRLVEVFDRHKVTFVAVTQSFNTTTSMGRLTLNILLSFAQFEREVIGERIRDKFTASRKRGMWMGGWAPFGYRVENRKLVIDETEANAVRRIFQRYLQVGSTSMISAESMAEGLTNRYGHKFTPTYIFRLLTNRVYIGEAVHKGTAYPGEHEPIIPQALWERVQAALQARRPKRTQVRSSQAPALLKGLIFAPNGRPMTPTYTTKRGKHYPYYITSSVLAGEHDCPVRRVPAGMVEEAVLSQVRKLVAAPEVVVQTWLALKRQGAELSETEVRQHLLRFEEIWAELFPAEQARLLQELVARVDVDPEGITVSLRTAGLRALVQQVEQGNATPVVELAPRRRKKAA
jgi:DNA invertase Pin-like site-specific DNA recombinase